MQGYITIIDAPNPVIKQSKVIQDLLLPSPYPQPGIGTSSNDYVARLVLRGTSGRWTPKSGICLRHAVPIFANGAASKAGVCGGIRRQARGNSAVCCKAGWPQRTRARRCAAAPRSISPCQHGGCFGGWRFAASASGQGRRSESRGGILQIRRRVRVGLALTRQGLTTERGAVDTRWNSGMMAVIWSLLG